MNLIVLAAGKGSRLGSHTKKIPKVLIPLVNDKTILDYHMLNANAEPAIAKTIVVSGFGDEYIRSFVNSHPAAKRVDILFNPFYGFSGPLGSLWMVGDKYLSEDFIICNGDTFFGSDFLVKLSRISEPGMYLGIDRSAEVQEDDMKVILEEDKIKEVSKKIPSEMAEAISTGMLMVKGESFRTRFFDALYTLVHEERNIKNNTPWHQLVNTLSGQVNATDMTGMAWHEVDTPEDLGSCVRLLHGKELISTNGHGE